MKNVIEKKLTNKLEKFVSAIQNPIFANRFRSKLESSLSVTSSVIESSAKLVINRYRKAYKFVYGKERVKRFLLDNIKDFEKDHQMLVSWIENGDVYENKSSYVKCKNRISAILKATRRLNSLKVADKHRIKSYLNEHINNKRFEKKYELAT
jgi:hypothetical protein